MPHTMDIQNPRLCIPMYFQVWYVYQLRDGNGLQIQGQLSII